MVHAKGRQELRISLRAVVYPHGEWWIAHCLELDVVAEGRDRKTAIQDLMDLCATQIETAIDTGNLESVFRPAPPEIWATFSRAVDTQVKKRPVPPVERFEAREARFV